MNYCKRYSRVAWSSPNDSGKSLFTRLRCKTWSCDYCAEIEARRRNAWILDNINRLTTETATWKFVTLTATGGEDRTPLKTLVEMQNVWRGLTEFWRKYHREFGMDVPSYVRVYEQHEDDAIHLHAIVLSELKLENMVIFPYKRGSKKRNLFAMLKWEKYHYKHMRLKDLSVEFGAGYMTDIQTVGREKQNAGLVASYITKYMTKDIQASIELPVKFRRIQASHDFAIYGYMPDGASDWQTSYTMTSDDYIKLKKDAKKLVDLQTEDEIDISSFEHGKWYPPLSDRE